MNDTLTRMQAFQADVVYLGLSHPDPTVRFVARQMQGQTLELVGALRYYERTQALKPAASWQRPNPIDSLDVVEDAIAELHRQRRVRDAQEPQASRSDRSPEQARAASSGNAHGFTLGK